MINRIPFCILILFSLACAGAQTTQQDAGNQNKFEKIQTAKTVVVESFVPKSVREICAKTPDPESFNPEEEPCIQRRQEELFKKIYFPSAKEKNLTKALELVLALKKVFPKKKLLIGKEAEIHVRHVQQKVEYCDSGQTSCVPVIHNLISFSDSEAHEMNKSYTVVPQLSYMEKEEKDLPMAKWGERLESISRENIDFILSASFVLE
ncbi:hypothetical protein CH379_007470 [Leptospira ellisii]|uniref:Lipoprotein n=1 Tax=Leptospira ellisii TaxID=2023197 RepID=A0A2N0BHV0_9LEPT|nr:hypothetical protein [Leptospira ellisii]MDV6235463.1 hypothetical protein [Leptospira ellisii]PJZ91631.1 hypothetical protein CH379_17590 [Leptospira ellisii]PKA03585.1 hypothetical protein CH375_16100 [Leptospira ellisii]